MTDHRILCGDSLHVLPTLDAESVDAIVCDPPYGLSFMGKDWDHGVPSEAFWREALRVAKPGAHLLAFGGTRTYHRLACAIEDAGWEIRDCLSWLYGSGFPKSLDVSKAMDKVNGQADRLHRFTAWMRTTGLTTKQVNEATGTFMGSHYLTAGSQPAIPTPELWAKLRPLCGDVPAWVDELVERIEAEREVVGKHAAPARSIYSQGERDLPQDVDITAPATALARQWQGWGTALKPAWEPIILARKPLVGTVASNVAQFGTGAVNVDGCRIATTDDLNGGAYAKSGTERNDGWGMQRGQSGESVPPSGRWPANVVLDEAAAAMFPESRFFYVAKASRREREAGLEGMDSAPVLIGAAGHKINPMTGREVVDIPRANHHPTVKPIALMRWLCRLVTPPNGLVLDPFTGSGSTGCAAVLEGLRFVGIEREPEYAAIAEKRIAHWAAQVETPEPSLFDG